MATTHPSYPVHVQGRMDAQLSRWLWLVKWLLAIPHYVILAFLWAAFVVLSLVAFVAILITGHYPRAIFEFNVGVLRWSWRVSYYAYGALGTDRYPPFTLADVPDYPARLDVSYPDHLSRGLVLVKWWLLAIPHYLVVGLFVGGGAWISWRTEDWQWSWGASGLVGLLVLISAVILAVTGAYPTSLFDIILGMNRWALRVAGYAGLMTDEYPPFRLDIGGEDPDGVLTLGRVAAEPGAMIAAPGAAGLEPGAPQPVTSPPAGGPAVGGPRPGGSAWTAGRVISLVIGAFLVLTSAGLFTGGAALAWAASTQRDSAGYLTTDAVRLSTDGYAITSDNLQVQGAGPGWAYPDAVIGSVRVRVQAADTGRETFVGIGRTADVQRYLSGTRYVTVNDLGLGTDRKVRYTDHQGGAPGGTPTGAVSWVAQSAGTGSRSLTWTPESGDWTLVVMNADGASGVVVDTQLGAEVPMLPWVAGGLLAAGAVLLLVGAVLIAVAATRASRVTRTVAPVAAGPVGPATPTGPIG